MQREKQIDIQSTLLLQLESFPGTSIKELKPEVLEKNERENRKNLKNEVSFWSKRFLEHQSDQYGFQSNFFGKIEAFD